METYLVLCKKNCIFEHMTNKIFPLTVDPFGDPWPPTAPSPKVEVLEPGAVLGKNIWGAWPLIIWEATTAKRNYYRTSYINQ